jgi:mannose-6-phosphate isomerase-like protein (cupin superfamily)
MPRNHKPLILTLTASLLLAAGWAWRERAFAAERARLLASQTRTQADVKMKEYAYEKTVRGAIGIYFEGQTAGTRDFVVGQFRLRPGEEPHPIHKHVEEEVLIVTAGKGEIVCDGKTTKVGPGSVMYTGPNAPHGIKNTGDDVLTFYFVKWTAKGR